MQLREAGRHVCAGRGPNFGCCEVGWQEAALPQRCMIDLEKVGHSGWCLLVQQCSV